MISEQGAILIATVYPIGILILAVDARTAMPRMFHDFPRVRRTLAVAMSTTVGLALFSVYLCIASVSSETPLDEGEVTFLTVSGVAMFGFVLIALFSSLISAAVEDD